MAVDASGNVYVADFGGNAIEEWNAATQTARTLISSVSSSLASIQFGVAVDAAGNVYVVDAYGNKVEEWNAAAEKLTTLVSAGIADPYGIAVDGAGNVYVADTYDNAA